LLQLFYNVLSSIWTTIIHNNDLKVHIPEIKNFELRFYDMQEFGNILYENVTIIFVSRKQHTSGKQWNLNNADVMHDGIQRWLY
jgi:hypothetical protein